MSKKKEFDELTGELKPDYPKPEIPDHLNEVDSEGNQKAKLNFSDYWNIVYAIFSDYAFKKLNPAQKKTVLTIQTIGSIIGGVIVLLGMIYCIRSCS